MLHHHQSLRTPLVFAAATILAVAGAPSAWAVCQIPLAIGQNTGNANVMILLDNSGSMNEALQSSDYSPSVHYSGNFDAGSSYSISSAGNYSPHSFNHHWASTPTAYLVDSDVGEDGIYYGNYLNWIYFHATAAQRAAIPVVTRIQAAKSTLNSFLATITDCRLGLMEFNPNDHIPGGVILSPMGSSVAAIQAQVNAVHAQTWTPLGETEVTALNYYSLADSTAPIQAACQKNFLVIVTDGLPTHDETFPSYIHDANHDGYYMDDVAQYMYRNDLRSNMDGLQNVATFTIGFNVDQGDILQRTADVGGGDYFSITDGAGLEAALEADFNTIAARVAAGAAVSVVSSENRTANYLFRARYESQTWRGFVETYLLPYHSGSTPVWDAGALLAARTGGSRTIYTSLDCASLYSFTVGNASTLRSYLGAANNTIAANIITYVQGDSVPGTRNRNGWKLGDVVDAAPLMVGKPVSYYTINGYPAWAAAHANRTEVLYVAANDGMLHCFRVSDGTELWSYIPHDQLANLSVLMDPEYCHQYFLNMTPAAFDVYIGGVWKTLLVGGEAQGGNGLFAIDVTDPTAPSLLWDVSPSALRGAYTPPIVVRDRILGRQALVIGTGYGASSLQTNLLIFDPANGSIARTLALGSPVTGNKTTRPTAFDRDMDGVEDLLYIGDLAGRMWRVDLTANPWTARALYSGSQPIQGSPAVTADKQGRPLVFFGTGQFLVSGDPSSVAQQGIYCVRDKSDAHTVTSVDLVDQTNTINPITVGGYGWFLNLPNSGERVIRTPALLGGVLYVPSFAPTAAACTGGGESWLYSLDYKDGSAPDGPDGQPNDTTVGRSQSMGDGILADPTVDLVNKELLLQSSNAVLLTEDISMNLNSLVAVQAWRQNWR